MADAVIRLGGNFNSQRGRVRVIHLYDFTAQGAPWSYPVENGPPNTVTVIPTDTAALDAEVLEMLTAQDLSDLDAGTHALEVTSYEINEASAVTETLDTQHAKQKAEYYQRLRDRYNGRGQRRTVGA